MNRNPLTAGMAERNTIQIFRAGTHRAMNGLTRTYTKDDLKDMADSYNKQVASAPLVVGHPSRFETDAPSYGEVRALYLDGEDLYADADVAAEMVDMVRNKNFVSVSASFYLPEHPSNPMPGHYYLKHVGFLGAVPPAVKGMKPLDFASHETNPLLIDAEGRGICFTEPCSFSDMNPLLADAERRWLNANHPSSCDGSFFCSQG